MEIPLIYLKDKQAFVKKQKTMRFIGKPIDIAKKLKDKGYILLHIVDLDAKKGMETNFDVYDKLTFFINIEVECGEKEHFIKRLLEIKARVVIDLPSEINLAKFAKQKRLLVGKIKKGYSGDAKQVHDVILEKPDEELISRFRKRRLILYDYKGKEKVWGVISSLKLS